LIPYEEDQYRSYLRQNSVIVAETHHASGTLIQAKVTARVADTLKLYEY
jgi:hypothetical protein